jgi:tetratricopeptide (TPR) repeat protein
MSKPSAGQPGASQASLFQRGLALHKQNNLPGAMTLYRQSLVAEGASHKTLYHLGLALFTLNKLPEALDYFGQAAKADAGQAHIFHYQGLTHFRLGQLDEAIISFRRALAIAPKSPATLNNLAFIFQTREDFAQAEALYRAALAAQPVYAEAHNNLGNTLFKLDRPDEAIACFKRALGIQPSYFEAHTNWGNVLAADGNYDEAILHYRQALRLNPKDAESLASIARVLNKQGLVEEALTYWGKSLALLPTDVATLNHAGVALRELGRADEAMKYFEKALRLAPDRGLSYLNIATTRQFDTQSAFFTGAQALLARPSVPDLDRCTAEFAMAHAYAKDGFFEESFASFARGNQLKRNSTHYDEAAAFSGISELQQTFTPALFEKFSGHGHTSDRPIFILGMPRSGTTLLEQIVSSHPEVFGAGELASMGNVAGQVAERMQQHFPQAMDRLAPGDLRAFADAYLAQAHSKAPKDARRVTDKMPTNFLMIGLIATLFPNARIILTQRDPRDVAMSCFSILFATGQDHTYDLGELGRYIVKYFELVDYWKRVIPAHQLLEITYEKLVGDLEGNVRQVIAHCGLDWHPDCLDFQNNKRSVRTASVTQVRQALFTTSIGRWRPYAPYITDLLDILEANPLTAAAMRACENAG